MLDLSPIGEYEDVFGESEYRSKLFPDEEEAETKEERKKDVLEEGDSSENKEEVEEVKEEKDE